MDSTLPPDPYAALGLSKDVDQATIKSTYRKLVLKCHPDKVTDESLKKQKHEEFHKIQQAWETIGEKEARDRYDLEAKLEAARKERFARGPSTASAAQSTSAGGKPARYEVRTQAPSGAAGATYTTTSTSRYEERKPSARASWEDRYDDYGRKYDTESYPKSTSRTPREKETPKASKPSTTERIRSDQKKSRDKEERRDRERKYAPDSDTSGDDRKHFQSGFRRRSDDAHYSKGEDEARKAPSESRRKEDVRRSHEAEPQDDWAKTFTAAESYIRQTFRPPPSRTGSTRDVRDARDTRDYFDTSASRREVPEVVRRSSARPKERVASRKPGIVEWQDDRRVPDLMHTSSSPADIHIPTRTAHRSFTEAERGPRRTEISPGRMPRLPRSETMPTVPSARTAAARPVRRDSAKPSDYPAPYGGIPSSTTKTYYYPTPGGNGVHIRPDDYRTVLHEPDRRQRSPSPLTKAPVPKTPLPKPPLGAHRSTESYSSPKPSSAIPPPFSRGSSNIDIERGRRMPAAPQRQNSYTPQNVVYSKQPGPDDVKYTSARSRGGSEREYTRAIPTMAH